MRTTIDIPEGLLRRARSRAALDGTKMKDVVNEALRKFLGPGEGAEHSGGELPERVGLEQFGRFSLPVVHSAYPGKSRVTPERLQEADLDEDQERHGAIFGR